MENSPSTQTPAKLEWWAYLVGAACLIPFFGVIAIAAAMVLGILKFRQGGWILFLFALLGAGVTGGVSFLVVHTFITGKSGVLAMQAEGEMGQLIPAIEKYKADNGKYPDALTELPPLKYGKRPIYDPFTLSFQDPKALRPYVYSVQPGGQTYYLFSRGPDGEPFTEDDVLPYLTKAEAATIGYRVRPLPQNPPLTMTPVATKKRGTK